MLCFSVGDVSNEVDAVGVDARREEAAYVAKQVPLLRAVEE